MAPEYTSSLNKATMTSYLSAVLTTTTSRYNNLRRSLLANENDGDTEDDTHISRVLRAYYVEKGRPFPEWLPPDPRAKVNQQQPQAYVSTSRPGVQTTDSGTSSRRAGGVSDLWDPPPNQPQPTSQPSSLRRNRNIGGGVDNLQGSGSGNYVPAPTSGGMRQAPPLQQHAFSTSNMNSMAMAQRGGFGEQLHSSTSAPMPNHRGESYQNQQPSLRSEGATPPPPGSSGSGAGGTAQERLKARLWGQGRSASPGAGGSRGQFG